MKDCIERSQRIKTSRHYRYMRVTGLILGLTGILLGTSAGISVFGFLAQYFGGLFCLGGSAMAFYGLVYDPER